MYRKNTVFIQYNCILHVFSTLFNTVGKWDGPVTRYPDFPLTNWHFYCLTWVPSPSHFPTVLNTVLNTLLSTNT